MDESFDSLTYNLQVSDELTIFIDNHTDIDKISEKRINQLLSLTESWISVLQNEINIIEDIKSGKIINNCVISEFEFWKKRYVHFNAILGQLSSKTVKKYLVTMEKIVDNQIVAYTLSNLKNVRHDFKIVYDTTVRTVKYFMDSIYEGIDAIINAPFSVIIENFTPLYNNLNLIWLTSSWFSRKKHMERLFELISNAIADRVSVTLNIPKIFRYKTSEALALIKDAIQILSQWKTRYYKCKRDIEVFSIRYCRRWAWEFDEDLLFNRINFVSEVVYDLDKIMEIIENKMLSPEVMFLFKDIKETQVFIKRYITRVFFELEIDVYKSNSDTIWKEIMNTFHYHFEESIFSKINDSIDSSTHVVDGIKALQFVENMMMRTTLIKQLDPKYSIVLNKFCDQINSFYTQFESFKSSPQLMIEVPPIAGNIILTRDLFLRAKSDAIVLKETTKLSREEKKKALTMYKRFCKEIFTYENEIFTKWLREAVDVERRHIQKVLLVYHENKLVSTFKKELFYVTDTALHLHILNYDLPEVIMTLISRREQILFNVKKIDELVKMHNDIIDKMDAPVLPKFIKSCLHSLKEFNGIYDEIKSCEAIISDKLALIENLTFFSVDFKNVLEISNSFDEFKIRGNENSSIITKAMDYIAEALNLIERTCYDYETGYREQMSLFYGKYEDALFEAFITMVLNNFKTLKNILDDDRVAFVVHGKLIDNKFALLPDVRTIVITLVAAMDDVSGKLKSVPRWLRTTNIRCPLVQDTETGDMHLPYSFYDHVVNQKHVCDAENEYHDSVEVLINRLKSIVNKLATFNFLFNKQDKIIIEEFAATYPTLNDYRQKLEFFSTLADGLESQSHIDLGCIRLDYSEYNDKLIERCHFWHSMYGKQLIFECNAIMTLFSKRIMMLKQELNTSFKDCQGLDIVEKCIKEIKETIFHADAVFHDIDNRFNFLKRHKINIPNDQLQQNANLKTNWQNLYEEALSKSFCFEDAKQGLV